MLLFLFWEKESESLCLFLCLSLFAFPSFSPPFSPSFILVPPVAVPLSPCCPFSPAGSHWHGHPVSPLLFPLQLPQQRVTAATGDPLAEKPAGHWPPGAPGGEEKFSPRPGLPSRRALQMAAKTWWLLDLPSASPRGLGDLAHVLKAQDIWNEGTGMDPYPQHYTSCMLAPEKKKI